MTYYENETGARVFSAGALDVCTTVATWPVRRMLENLWQRMLAGVPPPPGPPGV
jgi:hypothetical protein